MTSSGAMSISPMTARSMSGALGMSPRILILLKQLFALKNHLSNMC
jgi:hypothetical protein